MTCPRGLRGLVIVIARFFHHLPASWISTIKQAMVAIKIGDGTALTNSKSMGTGRSIPPIKKGDFEDGSLDLPYFFES